MYICMAYYQAGEHTIDRGVNCVIGHVNTRKTRLGLTYAGKRPRLAAGASVIGEGDARTRPVLAQTNTGSSQNSLHNPRKLDTGTRGISMRRSMITTCTVLVALYLSAGCNHQGTSLTTSPERVAPGKTVRVSSPRADFTDKSTIEVTFGNQKGIVVEVEDKTTIIVKVPRLDPGQVKITVRDKGRVVGGSELTILHPSKRRLHLTYADGKLELDRTVPYTGHYDRPAQSGTRLSYDVLSEKGALIYRGAVPLPGSRGVEILANPKEGGTVERVPRAGRIRFTVKIPYQAQKTIVRFYELKPGLAFDDPDRKFVREFEIEG